MQQFRRWIATLSSLVVAAASFALSYVALRDVAAEVGAVPRHLAWLVPIVIDGGIMCGSAVIWSSSKEEGRRPVFPFIFVASMVCISVVVNANHAADSLLAKVIAALPPLILLGTLELVASQGRKHAAASAAQPVPAAAPPRPAAPARQSWSSSTLLAPAPAMAMNASQMLDSFDDTDDDFGIADDLVEEIEESLAAAAAPARAERAAPPRQPRPAANRAPAAPAAPGKRALRVQAAQPDETM